MLRKTHRDCMRTNVRWWSWNVVICQFSLNHSPRCFMLQHRTDSSVTGFVKNHPEIQHISRRREGSNSCQMAVELVHMQLSNGEWSCHGAPVSRRQSLTADVWLWSNASSCRNCGRKKCHWVRVTPKEVLITSQYYSTNPPSWYFIRLLLTPYNLSSLQRC